MIFDNTFHPSKRYQFLRKVLPCLSCLPSAIIFQFFTLAEDFQMSSLLMLLHPVNKKEINIFPRYLLRLLNADCATYGHCLVLVLKDLSCLFIYFRSFQTQIYKKNCSRQRDSNSDRRSRRHVCWPLDLYNGPILQKRFPTREELKRAFAPSLWLSNMLRKKASENLLSSVTRLGDLLDFGNVFKAFGNN